MRVVRTILEAGQVRQDLVGSIDCARRPPQHIVVGPYKLASLSTLTGSDNRGLPHSVEAAVEESYVFSFVGIHNNQTIGEV